MGDLCWWALGLAPFAALVAWLFGELRRRGATPEDATLAVAGLVIGLPVGTALLPDVLGGIAGGLVGFALAGRALRLGPLPWRALGLGLLLFVAVGRLGCFVSGCCFGTPTELPWGVRHGPGSPAWALHHALEWIHATTPRSHPVHPFPLYMSAGLALAAAGWRGASRRLRSEPAALALALAALLGLRALLEGTRAMVNTSLALEPLVLGVSAFRWSLAGAALFAGALAVAFERRARRGAPHRERAPAGDGRRVAVAAALVVVAVRFDDAQTSLVHPAVVLAACAGLCAVALASARGLRHPGGAWAGVARAAALGAVALLGLDLGFAGARGPGLEPTGGRGWIYAVVPDAGSLLRLGSEREPRATLAARGHRLGLFELAPGATANDNLLDTADPRPRVWLGVEGYYARRTYAELGCGGATTVWDHTGRSLAGRLEVELPVSERGRVAIGGRGGAVEDDSTRNGVPAGRVVGAGQAWVAYEHPFFSAELGAFVQDTYAEDQGLGVAPTIRLRGGFEPVGFDAGILSSVTPLGEGAHMGVSGRAVANERLAITYLAAFASLPSDGEELDPGALLDVGFELDERWRFDVQAGVFDEGWLLGTGIELGLDIGP